MLKVKEIKGLCLILLIILINYKVLIGSIAVADNWPRFRGGASHLPTFAKVDATALQQKWSLRIPSTVTSSPIAVDGVAYIAAENGNIYAIELATQSVLWVFPTRGAVSSTPAVADGVLYALSLDGHLYAINTADGTQKWAFQTGGEQRFAARQLYGIKDTDEPITDPWDYFLSSPLVADGKVYFGSSDHNVYALDTDSGKLIWAYKTGGLIHSSPALADGKLVIGSWDGALYALDSTTGKELWRFQTETEHTTSQWLGIQSSAVIEDDKVYIGSRDGFLYALTLDQGKQLWRYDVKRSWVVPVPLVDETQIYFGSSDTGVFIALDKATGKENWRADTQVWTYSSAVLAKDAVIVGNMRGDLYAFSPKDGTRLWHHQSESATAAVYKVIDSASGRFDYKGMATKSWYSNMYGSMQRILHSGGYLASPAWYQQQLITVTTDGQVLVFSEDLSK